MTPLTPENARPGVRVWCPEWDVLTIVDYSDGLVALDGTYGRYFPSRFVLAEPEQSLSAVLSSRADGAALLDALRGWYRLHAPGGGPSSSKLIALYNAIETAGLAPAPPPAVTEQVAALRNEWWV